MRRALIAVMALAVGGMACTDDGPSSDDPPPPGTAAEGVTDQVLAGLGEGAAEVDLADYRGTPLVVNFFASTCAPCVEEMPAIEDAFRAADGAFAVLGVATNDRVDDALALVERTGVTWDLASDPDGSFIRAMGGTALPTTVLVDEDGAIVEVHVGALRGDDLANLLRDGFGITVSG